MTESGIECPLPFGLGLDIPPVGSYRQKHEPDEREANNCHLRSDHHPWPPPSDLSAKVRWSDSDTPLTRSAPRGRRLHGRSIGYPPSTLISTLTESPPRRRAGG